MRPLLLLAVSFAPACSLIVENDNTYTLTDAGMSENDAGPRVDAGPGFDAGNDDAGSDAGPLPPLVAPTLRHPFNGYMTGSAETGSLDVPLNALRPRFNWLPVDGADRYEIQLTSRCDAATRESCDFVDALVGTSTSGEWRPDEALPVSLEQPVGRRYVWRVRACRTDECFAWSEVRYLDVGRMLTDYDGNGLADLLIAGRRTAGGTAAAVYRPIPFSITVPLTAPHPIDEVVAVGDVDADGFPDAVGFAMTSTPMANMISLFRGASNLYSRTSWAADATGSPRTAAISVASVAAGDADGDGYAELVVGHPTAASGALTNAGRVFVFQGGGSGWTGTGTELVSPTPTANAWFGTSISLTADLDADGFVDAVIAADRENGAAVLGAASMRLWAPDTAAV